MAVHASRQHVVGVPLRRYGQTRIVADRRACLAKPVDAVVHRSPQIVCARRETSNGAQNSDGDSANRGDRDDLAFRRHVCLWRWARCAVCSKQCYRLGPSRWSESGRPVCPRPPAGRPSRSLPPIPGRANLSISVVRVVSDEYRTVPLFRSRFW